MEIVNLESRVPDQEEILSANNLAEEVFEDFSQDQSINLPSPIGDCRGVVTFGNRDCSASTGVNRVNCGHPSMTTLEEWPCPSVISPNLP